MKRVLESAHYSILLVEERDEIPGYGEDCLVIENTDGDEPTYMGIGTTDVEIYRLDMAELLITLIEQKAKLLDAAVEI
jgi:hypothetical protein